MLIYLCTTVEFFFKLFPWYLVIGGLRQRPRPLITTDRCLQHLHHIALDNRANGSSERNIVIFRPTSSFCWILMAFCEAKELNRVVHRQTAFTLEINRTLNRWTHQGFFFSHAWVRQSERGAKLHILIGEMLCFQLVSKKISRFWSTPSALYSSCLLSRDNKALSSAIECFSYEVLIKDSIHLLLLQGHHGQNLELIMAQQSKCRPASGLKQE